ncbi:hypothetical protein AJ88_48765 [Mesorhizobium amorphae CCBAU 01583]|nr:hypothetical protein AJ88_48765 [Mesorhizobium amorphae CCBAU 01583]
MRIRRLPVCEEDQKEFVAQIQYLETACCDVEVEASVLVGLYIGETPREHGDQLLVRHPMRRDEALGKVVAEVKILDRQHFGMPEPDVPHAARDRKGDLNVVVQRDIVDRVAKRALKARMDLVKFAKAPGDLWAICADEEPVHLEQAHLGGTHEQLYCVRLGKVDSAAVLDWVDAKEIIIIGSADEAFELR